MSSPNMFTRLCVAPLGTSRTSCKQINGFQVCGCQYGFVACWNWFPVRKSGMQPCAHLESQCAARTCASLGYAACAQRNVHKASIDTCHGVSAYGWPVNQAALIDRIGDRLLPGLRSPLVAVVFDDMTSEILSSLTSFFFYMEQCGHLKSPSLPTCDLGWLVKAI